MRDYKFRGKSANGGGWVYGYYVYTFEIGYNSEGLTDVPPRKHYIFGNSGDFCEVDPETVGQYIGDKNKGYEGDIISYVEPERGEHGDIMDYNHYRGVVEWDNERSGFILRCPNGGNEWLEHLVNTRVVGNRWDNPDLLEGEKI